MTGNHIFISYRSLEFDFARKLAESLAQAGYPIWLDRFGGILPGDNWRNKLKEGVENSFALIPVLSRNYLESTWCMRELEMADSLNISIIPVKIGDLTGTDLPMILQGIQYADFQAWETETQFKISFTKLLQGIGNQTGSLPEKPQGIPETTPKNPYRTDVEDLAAQTIENAEELEVASPFSAMEAEEIRKDMEIVMAQYQAVSQQYRLTVNAADLPKLNAQKAAFKSEYKKLEERLNELA